MYMWTENIEKLYCAKSLKTKYLTWQVFVQKFKSFLIDISESYSNLSLGVYLKYEKEQHESSTLEADKQLNVFLSSF